LCQTTFDLLDRDGLGRADVVFGRVFPQIAGESLWWLGVGGWFERILQQHDQPTAVGLAEFSGGGEEFFDGSHELNSPFAPV